MHIKKIISLSLRNEPHQSQLVIVADKGEAFVFEPNDDQLMLLLHQISHVLWSSCRQARRNGTPR